MESSVQHRIDADDTARESALHRHVHSRNSLQTSMVEQHCTTSGRAHLCGHRRKCASEILRSGWMPTSPQNNFGLPKGVLNFGFRIVNFGLPKGVLNFGFRIVNFGLPKGVLNFGFRIVNFGLPKLPKI